jgi:nucleotide-binding universal stress UspA family protein
VSEKGWKRTERKVAELLGGHRIPVSGRQRGDAADVEHPELSIECKSRQSIPRWLQEAGEQARAASRDGRLPVSVIHVRDGLYKDALCVIRLEDFASYMKGDASE